MSTSTSPGGCCLSVAIFIGLIQLSCGADTSGSQLLSELRNALGEDQLAFQRVADRYIPEIKDALYPTLAALPKNEHGKLGHAAVRYALHRLFARRHGWSVVGLDPKGESWNTSSPAESAVLARMPQNVRGPFEWRFNDQGLSTHEVAIFAAMLEHLIHNEADGRLRVIYDALEIPLEQPSDSVQVQTALDLYMSSYILGQDPETTPSWELLKQFQVIDQIYPSWSKTQEFVRAVAVSILPPKNVHFIDVARVVEEIGGQYGSWQNSECRALKDQLVEMEYQGSGRVRLSDFYGAALNTGKWQFTEDVSYLRGLGAIDESNPSNPRVIIPNYVNGASNCLASSAYYAVCCISECEDLFGHIERALGAPEATPKQIATLVASLPSSTVPANRILPHLMIHRLQGIAQSHNGLVPIHGRLFCPVDAPCLSARVSVPTSFGHNEPGAIN